MSALSSFRFICLFYLLWSFSRASLDKRQVALPLLSPLLSCWFFRLVDVPTGTHAPLFFYSPYADALNPPPPSSLHLARNVCLAAVRYKSELLLWLPVPQPPPRHAQRQLLNDGSGACGGGTVDVVQNQPNQVGIASRLYDKREESLFFWGAGREKAVLAPACMR